MNGSVYNDSINPLLWSWKKFWVHIEISDFLNVPLISLSRRNTLNISFERCNVSDLISECERLQSWLNRKHILHQQLHLLLRRPVLYSTLMKFVNDTLWLKKLKSIRIKLDWLWQNTHMLSDLWGPHHLPSHFHSVICRSISFSHHSCHDFKIHTEVIVHRSEGRGWYIRCLRGQPDIHRAAYSTQRREERSQHAKEERKERTT